MSLLMVIVDLYLNLNFNLLMKHLGSNGSKHNIYSLFHKPA